MFPQICTIGPVTIYSYGLMLAMAVLVCSWGLAKDCRRAGLIRDPQEVYDFVFAVVAAGIVGARLNYVGAEWPFFSQDLWEIFQVQHGGLIWQGGLVTGLAAGVLWIRRQGWPLGRFGDCVAPYLALGQAIGRLGCFLNGCCYGRPSPHGLYFPVHQEVLIPTQLWEAAGLAALFLVLKILPPSSVPGRRVAFYLMGSAGVRFVVEFFRGDHDPVAWGLTLAQIISGGLFLLGVGWLVVGVYGQKRASSFRGKSS